MALLIVESISFSLCTLVMLVLATKQQSFIFFMLYKTQIDYMKLRKCAATDSNPF